MLTALVIGLIVSVIDVLILLVICFCVSHSRMSWDEKKNFTNKIFGVEVKDRIKNIIFIVCINLLIEYWVYNIVFFDGPDSWRKYELESTKVYYTGEEFEMSPMITFVFEEDEGSEEKEYIIVEYEEKIKLTDKAPFNKIFNFLKIEVKTGNVENHVTSGY